MTNQVEIIEAKASDIVSPVVAQFVERYQTFLAKTIENILELGRVVHEVDQKLSGAERAIFCEQTNLKEDESTYRKLRQIGEKYEMLAPHKAYLPNSWTTVYQLSRLKPEQITSLAERNVLNPYATMKDISSQIEKKETKKTNEVVMTFSIILEEKDRAKLFQTEQEIRDLATRLGLRYAYNPKQYETLKNEQQDIKLAA